MLKVIPPQASEVAWCLGDFIWVASFFSFTACSGNDGTLRKGRAMWKYDVMMWLAYSRVCSPLVLVLRFLLCSALRVGSLVQDMNSSRVRTTPKMPLAPSDNSDCFLVSSSSKGRRAALKTRSPNVPWLCEWAWCAFNRILVKRRGYCLS